MPNFLIIGASKSGTSSLYFYLGEHPEIFISPVKEPTFFINEGAPASPPPWQHWRAVTDLDEYKGLFRGATHEKAIGEASVNYLVNPRAPERIKHHIPSVRMIAILRNPIDRAYSGWLQHRRQGVEQRTDFWEAVEPELGGDVSEPGAPRHLTKGLYSKHLERYLRLFDPGQLRVYIHDDFKSNPLAVVVDAYRFLGVDDSFVPHVGDGYTVGDIPRSSLLFRLQDRPPKAIRSFARFLLPTRTRRRIYLLLWGLNMAAAPPLPETVRRRLIPFFEEDVRRLSVMLRRDLSHWLGDAPGAQHDVPKNPGVHPSAISAL